MDAFRTGITVGMTREENHLCSSGCSGCGSWLRGGSRIWLQLKFVTAHAT